jgi:geranylgeranylglycerol-phosphate geranylgeranyltransferase
MKSMKKLFAFISLTRPLNATITFIGVCAAGYIAGAKPDQYVTLLFAALAAALLGSAGNCINDVFDVDIDRINRPARAIASGTVSVEEARRFSLFLAIAGLAISGFCGGLPFIIACLSCILIYFYNATLKHIPLVGNLLVGFLTGLTFIYGAAAVSNPLYGIIPAVFALLMNFAREILKDIEDMEGDEALGIITYPLYAGVRPALALVTAVFVALMIIALLPYFFRVYSEVYLWVVLPGVHCILIYITASMWLTPSQKNIGRLHTLLKYDMLVGIAALVLGSR